MDSQHVRCPLCQARLKLAAPPPPGKAIRCPKCGTAFRPQPSPGAGGQTKKG
jgi:predicted Zn finger-like uncharacterized protein